jgi:hypothetical protein
MHDDGGQRQGPATRARREAASVLGRLGHARPGQSGRQERAEAVLVLDSHLTMKVWAQAVDDLVDELNRQGDFARVRVLRLRGTDETAPARLGPEEPLGDPGDMRRVILVLTDGLAAGWRSGAVLPLLRAWGRGSPVAVVHVLPQQLWFRTGLDVCRVRLRAAHSWAANSELDWELRDAPVETHDPDEPEAETDTVLVPVLALTNRWAEAWTELVMGPEPQWLEMSAIRAREWKRRPDAARALPWTDDVPDPLSTVPAAERVSDFRAGASPTAFTLATRLAAVPLSLPLIRKVLRTTPGAGPSGPVGHRARPSRMWRSPSPPTSARSCSPWAAAARPHGSCTTYARCWRVTEQGLPRCSPPPPNHWTPWPCRG